MTGLASRATVVIGADGRILAIDRHVTPRTHGADIVDTLKKLGIGHGTT